MSETPLLIAIDHESDGELFVIMVIDFTVGQIRKSSDAMIESEAHEFFVNLGEAAPVIAKRFETARQNKGKV